MLNPRPDPVWEVSRQFWVTPTARAPKMLVSNSARRATSRSLTAYRGLRATKPRLARSVMGVVAAANGPVGADVLTVERRRGTDDSGTEPLAQLERVMDRPLAAVIGVRQGANAKATLQLFGVDGQPAGYAKVAWNALTRDYVTTEARALRALGGRAGSLRTPTVLADGDVADHPYLLTAPLPPTVRMLNRTGDLSLEQLTGMFPVQRVDVIRGTQQFRALRARLPGHARAPSGGQPAEPARRLAETLHRADVRLPVAELWHGDLVPWNAARDAEGQTWVWDWESSEGDTVAGLDVLHWLLNSGPDRHAADLAGAVRSAAVSAAAHLRALGMGPQQRDALLAVYALVLAERYWALAVANGGWHRHRRQPGEVLALLDLGQRAAQTLHRRGTEC